MLLRPWLRIGMCLVGLVGDEEVSGITDIGDHMRACARRREQEEERKNRSAQRPYISGRRQDAELIGGA